jgi:hypothetical protein
MLMVLMLAKSFMLGGGSRRSRMAMMYIETAAPNLFLSTSRGALRYL